MSVNSLKLVTCVLGIAELCVLAGANFVSWSNALPQKEEEEERCLSRQKRLRGRLSVLESIIFIRLSALGALNIKCLVFESGRLFEQFPAIVILFCNKTWRCPKGEFQLFVESLFNIQRKLGLQSISISLSVKYFFWWRLAWGGRLFKDGRFLTFPANRVGGYSRWSLFRGWALNQINTVTRVRSLNSLAYLTY